MQQPVGGASYSGPAAMRPPSLAVTPGYGLIHHPSVSAARTANAIQSPATAIQSPRSIMHYGVESQWPLGLQDQFGLPARGMPSAPPFRVWKQASAQGGGTYAVGGGTYAAAAASGCELIPAYTAFGSARPTHRLETAQSVDCLLLRPASEATEGRGCGLVGERSTSATHSSAQVAAVTTGSRCDHDQHSAAHSAAQADDRRRLKNGPVEPASENRAWPGAVEGGADSADAVEPRPRRQQPWWTPTPTTGGGRRDSPGTDRRDSPRARAVKPHALGRSDWALPTWGGRPMPTSHEASGPVTPHG